MKILSLKYFLFVCFFGGGATLLSQTDTVKAEKKIDKKAVYREARKASIMSAILPGLGQAYNRKWWKVPIVYAGLGGFGYLLYTNEQKYLEYGRYLKNVNDTSINKTHYNSDQLLILKNGFRKNRDLGIIGCALIYILNIVDANVDAHLKTFDVSDNLGLEIKPFNNVYCFNGSFGLQTGLSLNLKIKHQPQISRISTDFDLR